MALLDDSLALALVAGAVAYLGTFAAVERRVAPGDVAIVTEMARRRLARRAR